MDITTISPERAECLGVLDAGSRLPALTEAQIREALLRPVWPDGDGPSVLDVVAPGESVCFVVSDHTRKTAVDRALPLVLDDLVAKGCCMGDMSVLVASGIHRAPTRIEIEAILGSGTAARFGDRIFLHDPDDAAMLADVGCTSRGQRVRLNRRVVGADRTILMGAATYHYHAGFGGGRKSLVPGIASRDTIAHNHSLSLTPSLSPSPSPSEVANNHHPFLRSGVGVGRLDGNPVHEEMLECARLCPPDIIINTVLDALGKLVGVFSGELDAAHRMACRCVERVSRVDVERKADLVIASAEGARDWIQSHKALFNACRAVSDDGRVVLVAPCPEGLGNDRFVFWLGRDSVEAMYDELRKSAEVNGQTALSTRIRGARTILVTSLDAEAQRTLGIETAPDIESAMEKSLALLGDAGVERPTYYVMPDARYTVPFVGGGEGRCHHPLR